MKRTALVAAICLPVAVAAIAVLVLPFLRDDSLTRLRKTGSIRIGYAVEAPFAYLKPGGEVTGESPEVAKRVVSRLGIGHIEWRQVEFGALISELEAARIDVIAAGLFITPERAKRVRFSEPTFRVRPGLLVPKGNPRKLHSYQHVLTPGGVRIAVLSGAVEESLLRRLGWKDHELVIVPDALTGRVAVESAVADGLALSSPTVRWMALREQLGRTEMAQPFEEPELLRTEPFGYGAFAFRREDRRLASAWNRELKTYIGSPEHRSLAAGFGFAPAELPGTATDAEPVAR